MPWPNQFWPNQNWPNQPALVPGGPTDVHGVDAYVLALSKFSPLFEMAVNTSIGRTQAISTPIGGTAGVSTPIGRTLLVEK